MRGGKRLRRGYTTGSCAAAAAAAAAQYLRTGQVPAAVRIDTPGGIPLTLPVEQAALEEGAAVCGICKDAGDDPDVTDGCLICARVSRLPAGEFLVEGGPGVGRVTRPGLEQPVGAAAINRVPRRMIEGELRRAAAQFIPQTGLQAEIFVPEGQALAQRTYNPRLGILGGISILGTTGLVEPMSEAALVETIHRELDLLYAQSPGPVLVCPGSYGEAFCRGLGLDLGRSVLCSNFLGETVDYAAYLGFEGLLLVGHLGKLCKLAGGIFQTHSKVADARMEILTAHAALCGADRPLLEGLMDCTTTDAALVLLDRSGLLEPVMARLLDRIAGHLQARAPQLQPQAVVYTNDRGILGCTAGAKPLLERLKLGRENK